MNGLIPDYYLLSKQITVINRHLMKIVLRLFLKLGRVSPFTPRWKSKLKFVSYFTDRDEYREQNVLSRENISEFTSKKSRTLLNVRYST